METPDGKTRAPSSRHRVIALLGNPNTGKTTLFNALAGMRQHVGNYPGVTVETKKGHVTCNGQTFDLIDLPGTYSLAPRSPDEMVAVDLVLGQQNGNARPDVVVTVVDASNLERNLYLTTQAMDLGVPLVVALNMIDIARSQGLCLDTERMSQQLGVRVVPIQANKRRGLDELKQAIADAASESRPGPRVTFPAAFECEVSALHRSVGREVPEFLLRRLLLDVRGYTETRFESRDARLAGDLQAARQRLAAAGCAVPAVEARTRYGWIRQAITGCVERPERRPITWTDRLDKVLTHRVWGSLIFLLVMLLVFQAIFTWARPLMKLISNGKDALGDGLHSLLPPGPLASLLIDGVLEGVGSVVVFLPQILILFGFIAILEDCGYMARAAFLMDKLMSRCGLSGKSFIPMLSSVACAVPGIMATRVIENRRDRLTTILVAPLMSCSARLPVYILIIGAFLTDGHAWWVPGLTMFCMYAIGLVVAPLVAWVLKRTLLRGETPLFVMEMPVYKVPSLRTIVRRMSDSGWAFVRRAGTLILAAMIVVWALLYFPRVELPEQGITSDVLVARLQAQVDKLEEQIKSAGDAEKQTLAKDRDTVQEQIDKLHGEWKRQSWLGRMGRGIEPVVKPLGWDWKIGMAALASFPAREVVVGTLGIIYNLGKVDTDEIREAEKAGETKPGHALKEARWDDGRPVFTIPVALSLMVFFALCCQCASTLAIMRRETNSWRWPAFTFIYMTVLAYIGALIVYQVGSLFV